MIKFFRKLRQNSLMENKTGKYLKYAIGEIVLVVIGILIALWINSMNQTRIKQEKIDAVLVKIQNDFLMDIKNADILIKNYINKNSIKNTFIGANLTPKDIKEILLKEKYFFDSATQWSYSYKLESKGYMQLMSMLDDLPKKYDKLINSLSDYFSIHQIGIDKHSNNADDIIRQYNYYLANNHSWMAIDQDNDEVSDAQIDYMLNNPRFKNQMTLLFNSTKHMVVKYGGYREAIMDTYTMINELLGENATPLPKAIRTTSVANETDADQFVGIYKLKSGPKNTEMGQQIEVYMKDKNMFIITPDKIKIGPLLFLSAKKPWFINNKGNTKTTAFQIFRFAHKGENTLNIVNLQNHQTHWVKEAHE